MSHRRYSVNLGEPITYEDQRARMRSRNTVATLFPDNVKPGILSSMNIGADRNISSEEKALIEQMQADADIEALARHFEDKRKADNLQ